MSLAILVAACRENTLISSKLSPSNDTAQIKQLVLSCITHTYFDDTVMTNVNYSGIPVYEAIGNMYDPFFGTMTGSTFFQITPGSPGYDPFIDSTVTIDSCVLVVPFTYGCLLYGDTSNQNLTQTYQAFYMTDSMGYYSNYYSFTNKAVDERNPITAPFTVNMYHLQDSDNVAGADHASMRIRLNTYFTELLNVALANSYNAADPSAAFISAFNGICVRPADTRSVSNVIPYFELDGIDEYSSAGVLLYYHTKGSTITDTLIQQYSYNYAVCTHFNQITKSYSRYPINALLHSTAANDSIVALQNQPGASIDVKIYGINSIPKGVVINKAELQFTMLPQYNPMAPIYGPDTLGPPIKLYPNGLSIGNGMGGVYPDSATALNQLYLVADRYPTTSLTPLTMMDGYLHQFPVTNNYVYTVDLPREVMQAIAMKSDSIHLHINGSQDFYGAFHLVVGGGSLSDSTSRAKFVVTYSKLSH